MKKERIGLYGGTFNPIHEGHLALAKHVFDALSLDRLLFIPSGNPPHKKGVTDFKHRYAMTQCALEKTPFEACNIESLSPEVSYTLYTLINLRKKFPKAHFWWLVGEDTLLQLPRWHRIQEFHHYTYLAVTSRAGFPPTPNAFIEKNLPSLSPLIQRINVIPPDISSSKLREHLHQKPDTSPQFLPSCVYKYVRKHGLYL